MTNCRACAVLGLFLAVVALLADCNGVAGGAPAPNASPAAESSELSKTGQPEPPQTTMAPETAATEPAASIVADVASVAVSGDAQAYRFAVEVRSPDLGCDQYADWWEVLREDGSLVYRRILTHSHVDEQPFVRSGGPVEIAADIVVLVRAHMHPTGYGGRAMRGSVADGFDYVELDADFAMDVEAIAPQPSGCAF